MVSRSGQANEAGSVHRRGVAVYLVGHGLAGYSVDGADPAPGNPVPVALAFETDHATDDLLCTLSDGTKLFISAKRSCGDDAQFVETVGQWLLQVGELRDGDRLVLAVAEPKGNVRALGDALRRRRAAPGSVYTASETKALNALRARMKDASAEVQERVLDAAVVLTVDAGQAGRPHRDLASAMLEGSVVAAGDGAAAISHLEALLHTQAGSAYSGDVESWVRHLGDLGVVVYADRKGPVGAAIRARLAAVETYLAELRRNSGRIDLSLLADDVSSLVVPDLAEHLVACVVDIAVGERDPAPLLILARRRHRLLVEGLPGSGKSAAMTELAARWAGGPPCPMPILVRLRDLVPLCSSPTDVTLVGLCAVAAKAMPADQRDDLVDAMEAAIKVGDAVLLLDGLDECLERASMIVEGLSDVIAGIPDGVGLVLTTRRTPTDPARRLGLATVRLATPANLDAVLDRLLIHLASTRVAEADRETWVAARAQLVREIRRAHDGLEAVPLLSVLVTLIVADREDATPVDRSASILHRAVVQTVERWERRRPSLTTNASAGPSDHQFLLGFTIIGHMLAERSVVPVADVRAGLAAGMAVEWGLAPGPAEEAATQIQRFWDETAGVFIADGSGFIVARSRVFAEIGTAMRCTSLSATELSEWVSSAVPDPDRRMALLLSVQLDVRVMDELLRDGLDGAHRARLASAAVRAGAVLSPAQAEELLQRLSREADDALLAHQLARQRPSSEADAAEAGPASDATRHRTDPAAGHGPVWSWAAELAELRLPPNLDDQRLEVLTALPLTVEQRTVARGIAVLAAAEAESRALTPEGCGAVREMLAVPPPAATEIRQVSRRRVSFSPSAGLLHGLSRAVARAARQLPDFSNDDLDNITTLARRSSARNAREIWLLMQSRGHALDIIRLPEGLLDLITSFTGTDPIDLAFLESLSALTDSDPDLSDFQTWRLPDLCDFFSLLGIDDVGVGELHAAMFEDDEATRQLWFRSLIQSADMDQALIAAQARAARTAMAARDRASVAFEMASAWPDTGQHRIRSNRLTSVDRASVATLLGAKSEWIAARAAAMLWEARDTQLSEQIAATLPTLPPTRRFLAATTCCRVSENRAERVDDFFGTTDPALRRAAASIASMDTDPRMYELASRAVCDDDLSVRQAATAVRDVSALAVESQPALHWSCTECLGVNPIETDDCESCSSGTKPRIHD